MQSLRRPKPLHRRRRGEFAPYCARRGAARRAGSLGLSRISPFTLYIRKRGGFHVKDEKEEDVHSCVEGL